MLEAVLLFPLLVVFAIVLGIGLAYLIHSAINDDDDDTPNTGATGGWAAASLASSSLLGAQ